MRLYQAIEHIFEAGRLYQYHSSSDGRTLDEVEELQRLASVPEEMESGIRAVVKNLLDAIKTHPDELGVKLEDNSWIRASVEDAERFLET